MRRSIESGEQERLDGDKCSDRLRVLVLFGGIPLYGQERANLAIFTALRNCGVESCFLTHAEHGYMVVEPELDRLGLDYAPAPYGPIIGTSLNVRGWWRVIQGIVGTNLALLRELRRFRPTHLHVMNPLYALYASPLLFLCRVPVVYRIGDKPPVGSLPYRLFWRLLSRRITALGTNADYVSQLCAQTGFPKEKLHRIYSAAVRPPVPRIAAPTVLRVSHYYDGWHQHEEITIEPKPGVLTAVYCGQLTQNKGFHLAVEAVTSLVKQGWPIRLLLAGDYSYNNPLAADLKAKTQKEGLADSIQFLGFVEEVPHLLALADVHLCPSIWEEPLANVVIEAKAAGVPSIVFPNGGLPEAVRHNVDGWICQAQTAQAIEEALRVYLDQPQTRHRHGEAARESASGYNQFGPERFQREWLQVFVNTAT